MMDMECWRGFHLGSWTKEINVAEVSAATSTETELKSTPAVGNLKGDALLAGSTVAVSAVAGATGIAKIFGGSK